jgi:pyruvate dehydrogenase E2 component (dihydrolipoamide acetyltransferase)
VRAALEGRPALTAAARASGAELAAGSGSGLAGRVTVADLAAPAASPVEGGASGLAGSGRAAGGTGRVTVADLAAGGNMAPAASGLAAGGLVTDTPIKGIRKLIAGRMYQSLAESAQLTLNGHAPAARMQALRARMKASDAELGLSKLSLNDLILYAVSRVLPRYPFMNAHKLGDIRDGSAVLRSFERVHLGMAVDTPRGLMVPVIRNADSLSLRQISAEAKRLAAAAQTGAINPDELSGSSFTVTNLGSLGVTAFTPILNLPEVAILGVCGIELRPVEQDGADQRFSLEPYIGFSLTINHQVVDGAPAARFLKTLGEAVADIDLWLAL